MRLQIYTEVYFYDGKVWLNEQSLTQKFPKYETPYWERKGYKELLEIMSNCSPIRITGS